MNKVSISVFTSPTCPHCPSAVKLANEVGKKVGAKVITYSTATDLGRQEALKQEIMTVPTILVKGDGYEKNIGFRGTPIKTDLLQAIKIANGQAKYPVNKSLFEKIKDKLGLN